MKTTTPTSTNVTQRAVESPGRSSRRETAARPPDRPDGVEGGLSLRDRFQALVWRKLVATAVRSQSVRQQHRAPVESDYVRPIPAGRRYPGLLDTPLFFSENTPSSEKHDLPDAVGIRFMWWLKEWYAMGNRLHQRYVGVGAPYPKEFARLQPVPRIPEDFDRGDRLAGVARRGPFSIQTRADGKNEFVIDLRALEWIDPREPFIATGGLARFRRSAKDALQTVGVEFRGKLVRPGDLAWALTEKRFLTGLNSYTTFVEHLVYLHIITAGVWSIAAHMAFSSRHPLRLLLQPFTEETSRVNNYNIDGLILTRNSNVPLYSGYSLEQSDALLRQSAAAFDVRVMDAEQRAKSQGQLGDEAFPTVESAVALFRIFREFTTAWCRAYLKQVDLESRIFCQELDRRVPQGIRSLVGINNWDELTVDHVAHIAAVGAFAASVSHYIVGDMTRDYMLAFHVMPPALDAEGYTTLGLVMEKQESIVIAGIQRYMLMAEAYTVDDLGRRLWADFQANLKTYESKQEGAPAAIRPYLLPPSRISSSIHA